jgi:polysaccharide deacetylase 2 family uncharacterized protein YibQ
LPHHQFKTTLYCLPHVIGLAVIATGNNKNIYTRLANSMLAETLPDLPFKPVSLNGITKFSRYGQTQPGMVAVIG